MKVREIVEEVKNELSSKFETFATYDNEWLDMDVDNTIPLQDFKKLIEEKIADDSFLLNNPVHRDCVNEDEKNIIKSYKKGEYLINVENEDYTEVVWGKEEKNKAKEYEKVRFGEETFGIKPNKIV